METLKAADPDTPSLHGAQLWISMFYEGDWAGAEVAWQRASALWDPSDESLVPPMILYLTLVERAVEADLVLRRALESNPFSTFLLAARAFVLPYLDRSEEGVASASAAIELDPEYWFAYPFRSIAHLYAGDPTTALSDLDRARELEPGVPFEVVEQRVLGYAVRLEQLPQPPDGRGIDFAVAVNSAAGEIAVGAQIVRVGRAANPIGLVGGVLTDCVLVFGQDREHIAHALADGAGHATAHAADHAPGEAVTVLMPDNIRVYGAVSHKLRHLERSVGLR